MPGDKETSFCDSVFGKKHITFIFKWKQRAPVLFPVHNLPIPLSSEHLMTLQPSLFAPGKAKNNYFSCQAFKSLLYIHFTFEVHSRQ